VSDVALKGNIYAYFQSFILLYAQRTSNDALLANSG